MCNDPQCKNETEQANILAKAMLAMPHMNGRCEYHEDIRTGQATVKGGMAVIMLLLSFITYNTYMTAQETAEHTVEMYVLNEKVDIVQTMVRDHSLTTAHPVMEQRYKDLLELWETHVRDFKKRHPDFD